MRTVVATDGSQRSVDAVRRAAALLAHPDTVILVFAIGELPGDDAGGIEGSTETPAEHDRDWTESQAAATAAL